ncbi:DUF3102 domain-containing protein [Paenibacillus thermotolerans]|uniref:DUF3102 domain-containing protein n=1 Tax=Paenibacillus thermotolerans TaxID=3027807 RepID=UPI002368CF46|nr:MULTISPECIES: DUF3102 domain-containing protein [unclassified Paenibacillus]
MNALTTRTPIVIAAEINSIKDQTRSILLQASIEIGRRLVEAKAMVPHGEWGNWLEETVDYSQSTANNLMKIYQEYGNDQMSLFGDATNSQALGNLSYTQAVALLGIPAHEREKFVEEHDVESMSTRELQQAIKEKQILEKQLKEEKEKAEIERQERQKIEQNYEALQKKSLSDEERVRRLERDLEEAETSGDGEEVNRLKKELDKSGKDLAQLQKTVKELEDELNKKPIDVPATTVIEKVPDEIEKELNELREKVAKQNNKPVIKFTYCFESLVKGFQDLLGALDEIKTATPEEHEKYKKAVVGLMNKMGERL